MFLTDSILRMLDDVGITLISSVKTHNTYRIPISLTEDVILLMAFLDAFDEGVRRHAATSSDLP